MKSKYSKVVITVWAVARCCFNDERLVAKREIPTEIIPDDASTFDFFTDFQNVESTGDYSQFAKNLKILAIDDEKITYVENGKTETSSTDMSAHLVVNDCDKAYMLSYEFKLYK